MKPHELTRTAFIAQAEAIKLEDHGRMWKVVFGDEHAFSDAETPELAKAEIHHLYCNNAVYFNDPDNISLCPPDMLPSIPSDEVLEPYPDLLMWKIEMAAYVADETGAAAG